MKHMANELQISVAQLSAVETGRRKLTDEYVTKVIQYFASLNLDTNGIQQAADQSKNEVTIDLGHSNEYTKGLASSFARRFPTFSDKDKERLAELLNSISKE